MIAYKVMRLRKNGTLGTLFINRKQVIPLGVWLDYESHETKGFAFRPGWHCMPNPVFPPQLAKHVDRVICEVEVEDFEMYERKFTQGMWILAKKIKVIRIMENEN